MSLWQSGCRFTHFTYSSCDASPDFAGVRFSLETSPLRDVLKRTELNQSEFVRISNLGLLKSHLLTLDELRPSPPMMEVQAIERSRSRYDETPRPDSGCAGTFSRVSPRSFDLNSSVDPAFDIRERPTSDHTDGRACKKIGTLRFRRKTWGEASVVLTAAGTEAPAVHISVE